MVQSDMGVLLAAAVVATAFGALVAAWLLRGLRRGRLRRRQGRALAGERAAERLLHACGYEVIERQARTPWHVSVDGEQVPVELRADYLVRRNGLDYVAEVKTGNEAPSPRTPSTRRQLLEYGLAYPVAGTLLVDMEARRVREVRFPHAATRPTGLARWLVWGLLWTSLGWWLGRI